MKFPWSVIELILERFSHKFPDSEELKELVNSKKLKRGEVLTEENWQKTWEIVRIWLPSLEADLIPQLQDKAIDKAIDRAKKNPTDSLDESGNIIVYTDDLVAALRGKRYSTKDLFPRVISTKKKAKKTQIFSKEEILKGELTEGDIQILKEKLHKCFCEICIQLYNPISHSGKGIFSVKAIKLRPIDNKEIVVVAVFSRYPHEKVLFNQRVKIIGECEIEPIILDMVMACLKAYQ